MSVSPEGRPASHPPPPRVGRYDILETLGRGGMAVVYRARDTHLGRDVAIKVLHDPIAADATIRQRFLREARVMASLTTPHVVKIYDVGGEDDRLYLALELVEGRTLGDLLGKPDRGLANLARLIVEAARGVHAAHEQGIIHRDLKPQNIFVTGDGLAKVGDFGLAHTDRENGRLTRSGAALGTPLYMAPEQVKGRRSQISPATDVYALGAILYEAATGRPPHNAGTAAEIYLKILNEDPPPPRSLNVGVPPDVEAIILKALSKNPADRYPDAGRFADELQRWCSGQPILTRRPTLIARTVRKVRIVRTSSLIALGCGLAGLTLGLLLRSSVKSAAPAPSAPAPLKIAEAPVAEPPKAEKPAPPARPVFRDVTDTAGIAVGIHATWADLDNDGRPDTIVGNSLFRNLGDGTFKDVTTEVGLRPNGGRSGLVADFDNDGHRDIYFCGGAGSLHLSTANGRFRRGEADPNPHPYAQSAAVADIDGDGWVDVYIANYETADDASRPYPDVIFKNDKGRLKLHWTAPPAQTLPARGVTFCDFNEDGHVDAYVSNFRVAPNLLWIGQGGSAFTEAGVAHGVAGRIKPGITLNNANGLRFPGCGHTIGSAWADFDNDGLFDLFVGNYSTPADWQDRPQFLRNTGPQGEYRFEDMSARAAIPWQQSYANPAAGDFDNDGFVDLYFTTVEAGRDTSRLFRNRGEWRFEDITGQAGVATRETYQAAWADYDGDGRLDLLAGGRLFHNETQGCSWIKVALTATHCNREAIGARVTARVGDRMFLRQVECGSGISTLNDLTLHFGLGGARGGVELEVRWPCGKVQQTRAETGYLTRVIER